jgi:hypothetical protein
LICDRQGFTDWLDVTFPIPVASADPHGFHVWTLNDRSLKAFILHNILQLDYKAVCNLPDSRAVFAELRQRHEKLGGHTQILLIKKAMKLQFKPGIPLSHTLDEIDTISEKIKSNRSDRS